MASGNSSSQAADSICRAPSPPSLNIHQFEQANPTDSAKQRQRPPPTSVGGCHAPREKRAIGTAELPSGAAAASGAAPRCTTSSMACSARGLLR